jgi:hypothetical protein
LQTYQPIDQKFICNFPVPDKVRFQLAQAGHLGILPRHSRLYQRHPRSSSCLDLPLLSLQVIQHHLRRFIRQTMNSRRALDGDHETCRLPALSLFPGSLGGGGMRVAFLCLFTCTQQLPRSSIHKLDERLCCGRLIFSCKHPRPSMGHLHPGLEADSSVDRCLRNTFQPL